MKVRQLFFVFLLLPLGLLAQREGGIWYLGDNHYLDLNSTPVQQGNTPIRGFRAATAICRPNGSLRFYVRLTSNNEPMIFHSGGMAVPGSNLLSDHGGNSNNAGMPVVIPRIGTTDQYFVFYSRTGGLFYSLVDMSLNNGMGGMVLKDVQISGYSTIVPGRMVAVPGCAGIWLVARSATHNRYYSFLIGSAGVSHAPVVSETGLMNDVFWPSAYFSGNTSSIKASPNGKTIATFGTHGSGLEIYDFQKCSGKLTNPRIIDTLHNPLPSQTGEREEYTGITFSAGSNMLYVAKHGKYQIDSVTSAFGVFGGKHGKVIQYDLLQGTTASIIASARVVMENPYILLEDLNGCGLHVQPEFVDIKRGPDGRIYVYNNVPALSCHPGFSPSYSTVHSWHIIDSPNLSGSACQPRYNVINSLAQNPNLFYQLSPDYITNLTRPDTVNGATMSVTGCFRELVFLRPPVNSICYQWYDGTNDASKIIDSPGTYSIAYYDSNCTYRTDSFKVQFIKLPRIVDGNYSCPDIHNGEALVKNIDGDTTQFKFQWIDANGGILRSVISTGDTINNLDTGVNYLRITTWSGCDTTVPIRVRSLPKPNAKFDYDEPICAGQLITFENHSNTPLSTWFFDPTEPGMKLRRGQYTYDKQGRYPVTLVVQNVEGCTDTLTSMVEVKDFRITLIATPNPVNIGDVITLNTNGSVPYQVLHWVPEKYFSQHDLKEQHYQQDTVTKFRVFGKSVDGCPDSAEVKITINPVVFIPSAFTPNGDGKNDFFRATGLGTGVSITRMEIYNRWGARIFVAYNDRAEAGWDGTYNGKPCELGTYYFTLIMESATGIRIDRKGDFSLIR